MMIQPFAIYSFLLLLIMGTAWPSDGNHGFFSPKSLSFLSAAAFFALYFITRPHLKISQAWGALILLSSLSFFGFFYIIGIDQDPQIKSGQFDQFKIFITTLFPPFVGWFLIKDQIISFEKVMKTIIYTNCAYNVIKTLLMVLHVLGIINVWKFMDQTGLRFMNMHIIGDIGRIQTSVDIIFPFLVFFVLHSENLGIKLSKPFKWLFLISGITSVFLSFSRFLIFTFLFSLFLYFCTLPFFKQIKTWIFIGLISCIGIGIIGPATVMEIVDKRFFSTDNAASDTTREEQIDAMMQACDESPFFGKGLGGYTRECIRDYEVPHAYEVQWVSFLMQFGLVGLFIILLSTLFIASNFLSFPWTLLKISFLLLFGLWLLSGFTNPFLISLTSGLIYMIFLLSGERIKKVSLSP